MDIQDLGEQGLLKRLQSFCPADVVGDDAALITVADNHQLVATADVLVDGVHFSWGFARPELYTTSPYDAGWRAAAANLSDIAAMGAAPLGITVGLSLPPLLPVHQLEAFYQGLKDCLDCFDTPIVGGDVCRSSVMTVAIAAYGQVLPQQVISRATAKPGDVILVTGYHGSARAGLELLLKPTLQQSLSSKDCGVLCQAHQRPWPRLDVVEAIKQVRSPQGSSEKDDKDYRLSGMDSSDGLADAVLQISRASQVGAVLDRMAIPIAPELRQWTSPQKSLEWALYGGEDFELVLCCDEAIAHGLIRTLEGPAYIIGTVTAVPHEVIVNDPTGRFKAERLSLDSGFQHF